MAMRETSANKGFVEVLGQMEIPYKYKNNIITFTTIIVADLEQDLLLGYDFWRKLGLKILDTTNGSVLAASPNTPYKGALAALPDPETEGALAALSDPETKGVPAASLDPEEGRTPAEWPDLLKSMKTEVELGDRDRRALEEAVKHFLVAGRGFLGRTHLVEHRTFEL